LILFIPASDGNNVNQIIRRARIVPRQMPKSACQSDVLLQVCEECGAVVVKIASSP